MIFIIINLCFVLLLTYCINMFSFSVMGYYKVSPESPKESMNSASLKIMFIPIMGQIITTLLLISALFLVFNKRYREYCQQQKKEYEGK